MYDILAGKTILVTGASGLLGGAVARALLRQGHTVRLMGRSLAPLRSLAEQGAELVQADMTDPVSLEHAVSGCQVVFHFAGALADEFAGAAYFRRVNVEGSLRLARASLANGVERFLHTSTAWVYGYDAAPNTDERSPYRISADLYIDTKIEAEQRLQQLRQESGLPLVILQPSEVYGPRDRHWTLTPLRYLSSGRLLLVDGGRGLLHPIYVDDVVEGALAAARRGRVGEAYLLCGPEPVTIARYYGEFAKMLGRKSIPSIPAGLAMALAISLEGLSALTHRPPLFSRPQVRSNTMRASYDGGKACAELGFLPQVSLAEGMQRVAAWLQAEQPLGK